MLQGLMQDRPLLISTLIERAALWHPRTEVVSRTADGVIHRYTDSDVQRRAKQLPNVLTAIGVLPGDRVATLARNGHRHLELYYGVSGIGAVLHTLNPRLDAGQIEFIIRHAEDSDLFFDLTFLPLVEALAPRLLGVKGFAAMAPHANRCHPTRSHGCRVTRTCSPSTTPTSIGRASTRPAPHHSAMRRARPARHAFDTSCRHVGYVERPSRLPRLQVRP